VRITSEDLEGSVEKPGKSYNTGSKTSSSSPGTQMGKWSSTLKQLNQVLRQLNEMGIVQTQNVGNQQQTPQQPQSEGGSRPNTQGNQGRSPDENVDSQVNRKFNQAVQLMNMLPQEEDLSEETTLSEAHEWLLQNEQDVKAAMRQFIESGQT